MGEVWDINKARDFFKTGSEEPLKYRNRKVEIDGFKFDSIKEGKRYGQLKILWKIGEIKELKMQVKFFLQPLTCKRPIKYFADFTYYQLQKDGSWLYVVEDVKSDATRKLPAYIHKRKLMLQVHNITLKET